MKNLLKVYILFFFAIQLSAQTTKIDSLIRLTANSPEDTNKVTMLLSIADLFESSHQDSSLLYLDQAYKLARKLNFKKGIFSYYLQRGIVLFTQGNYSESMKQHNLALQIAEEMGDSSKIVNILVNTGIVYQYLGRYDLQLKNTLKALLIIEKLKLYEKYAGTYHNIGNAYYNIKQYQKSLEYCLKAISIHKKYGGQIYLNRILSTIGQDYEQQGRNDSALYYYKLAVAESIKQNDKYAEASIYSFMCNLYAGFRNYAEMLKVAEKSVKLSKELQSNQLEANSLYNFAYAKYFNGNFKDAKEFIYKALRIAEKDTLIDELKNIYTILTFISASENDFNTLLWAKTKADSVQQVLLNNEVIRASIEYQEKYESDKKLNQIKLQQVQLQHKRLLNFILLGGIFWILLVSFLVYRNLRHRHKLQQNRIQELETEKQLAATEAVLKGEEKERTRLAKDLHDGLGGMLSGIKYSFTTMKGNIILTPENQQAFERGLDMLDSSIREMRRVAHNMMPEALVKFGLDTALLDLCNDITQSGALVVNYQSVGMEDMVIEQTTSITIFRIIQELLNNTMKHANAKSAMVQLSKSGNNLTITVEDDGKGFDTKILDINKGIGWVNIRNRIEFLKGKLDVSSGSEEGTSVQIELNI